MNELSGSQVDKLGRRLRHAEAPSAEDLQRLERVRRADEDARLEVIQALLAERLQGTSRLKTTSTIIEKLRRESTMHLSRMQDIAGVRIVIDGDRLVQDRVVERIRGLFQNTRIIDRRAMPSFGYRAVHVIVRARRHIRPPDPLRRASRRCECGAWDRRDETSSCRALMAFSEDVDAVESMTIMLLELEADEAAQADPARSAQLSEIRAKAAEVEREVRSSLGRVHAMLHSAAEGSGGQT